MKKKGNLSTILLILILVMGLSLMLYPTVSEAWNTRYHKRTIDNYENAVAQMDTSQYEAMWDEAVVFNARTPQGDTAFVLSDEEKVTYASLLNLTDDGIMGYVEVPSIGAKLALYHGTSDTVLQVGVGHLEWSSLPVGGEGTHAILSGHRGLPSARLFTDLDQLEKGDVFMLHILHETLTYEVDQILIVLPDETEALLVEEGKDLCTLVTCTPYGVNSHRLLVRGHRVENAAQAVKVRVTADALRVSSLGVAAVLYVPILLLFLSMQLLVDRRTNRKRP